eukprot:16322967-Heterocapsa_arctica.AAC.1
MRSVAVATFGLAIGHQNVDFELGQLGCLRLLLQGSCVVVIGNTVALAAWLRQPSGGKEISFAE